MSTGTLLAPDAGRVTVGAALRIGVVNWGRRGLGGVETYLTGVLPELRARGHELALWTEMDEPADREPIPLPAGTPEWCAGTMGYEAALAALRDWRPDLLFVHLVTRPESEHALLEIAPAVLFAHGYLGACISGERLLKRPVPRPCDRRFGAACLLHYYADRCGGLSPLTMIRDYRRNVRRRELLPGYRAVVTGSTHMRDIYSALAGEGTPVSALPLPADAAASDSPAASVRPVGAPWHLLFTGRMADLKGGRILLEAVPAVVRELASPVVVTLAGEGPQRPEWERLAAAVQGRLGESVSFEFVGWKEGAELDALRDRADLLVVPSIWPEPFGLVGPEAGLRGLPAVAFASGGIGDWLVDDVNGYLAPADPPTAGALASAIVRALEDPERHARLREGARSVASRFSMHAHLDALSRVFARAVGTNPSVS